MFKKLASLLFEEEDVNEEPVEEKVDLLQIKKTIEIKNAPAESLLKAPLNTLKKSSFENITADETKPSTDDFNSSTKVDKEASFRSSEPISATKKPGAPKDVYEFKPVISPMFGIAESEKEHLRPTFVQAVEVKNDSHLQTVISPYYGAIHKDLKTTGPAYSHPVSLEPSPIKAKVAEYVEEPKPVVIENISLEALIQPKPIEEQTMSIPETAPIEADEDITQFSLFGED